MKNKYRNKKFRGGKSIETNLTGTKSLQSTPIITLITKRSILKKIILTILIISLICIGIYIFFNHGKKQSFTAIIKDANYVRYVEDFRKGKLTSPLCGCLDDSISHDGILIPSRHCKIKWITNDTLSNYMIGCPDVSEILPKSNFTFEVKVYEINSKEYQKYGISNILNLSDTIKKGLGIIHDIGKTTYFSIITFNEMEVYSSDPECFMAYIGGDLGDTEVAKGLDSYEGKVRAIKIVNFRNGSEVSKIKEIVKSASIDVRADRVFVVWKGPLEYLTPSGKSSYEFKNMISSPGKSIDTNKDFNDRINIAEIKPINTCRLSMMPWNHKIENYWLNQNAKENFKLHSQRKLSCPNYTARNYDAEIIFDKLWEFSEYKEIYNKYIKNTGYYHYFDSTDYEIFDNVRKLADNPLPSKNDKSRGGILLYQRQSKEFQNEKDFLNETTDAHELLNKANSSRELIDTTNSIYVGTDTFKLKDGKMYFRYPPLHKDFGVSIYCKYQQILLNNCEALINVSGKKYSIDKQMLELADLEEIEYEYPSMFLNLEESAKKFVIRGKGTVYVDGKLVKEDFYESKFFLILSSISVILTIVSTLFSIFNKRNSNTQV